MDVCLSSEQRQLEDSVRRLLSDHYAFAARRKISAESPGWSRDIWARYAEIGVLAIATPEDNGGLSGGGAELLPVMQAFGSALGLEPLLSSAVLGATALACASNEAAKDQLLQEMAAGETIVAFAHQEAGIAIDDVQLLAEQGHDGWQLSGNKRAVLQAADAEWIIVTARASAGEDGMAMFLVAGEAAGLRRHDYLLIDQRVSSDLQFNHVPATLLIGPSRQARHAIQRTLNLGAAALVAEAAGAMRAALEVTTEYLRNRKQFGRALAENQVLRHRTAEMLVAVETVEAMAYLTAITVDSPDSVDGARDIFRAKLLAGQHGRWLCEQAIQLHGGIGLTDEYVVGHYLQRLAVIDALLGDQDAQLDRLVAA
jgi:pimeloyl-CoA dehydrogenase